MRLSLATILLVCLPFSAVAQTSYQVLHVFAGSPADGANAFGALIEGADGHFYGTTQRGGAFGAGVVYRLTRDGIVTILHSFTGGTDGGLPAAGLVEGDDGTFYGTTITSTGGLGTAFRITAGGAFTLLHNFAGYPTDGGSPYAPLIKGRDGMFYGVTFSGGPANAGTVYRMTPAGAVTILHAFTNAFGDFSPFGPLVEASDGTFFGTMRFGLIYRVSASGAFAVVRQLNTATEGTTLDSALAAGTDGNLYGTARNGGPTGGGTVFRITPDGAFTLLHAFTGGADGDGPEAGLVSGSDGAFYGTTAGSLTGAAGCRVFRITPSGALTVLHTFDPADASPNAPLLPARDGSFYGTTTGGASMTPTRSVVFRVTPALPVPSPPFGSFDTPSSGETVAGEVGVTGWALDDTAVTAVSIYRSPVEGEGTQANGLVFIGTATFVPGARPDVASIYDLYPNNTRAGWGYMLLSNMLPSGGNGIFTLYAVAADDEGHTALIGQKVLTVSNSENKRPFGTIDTPAQGATVSGVIDNFGWALTPDPAATIPFDGSTITVYVDGVSIGHPTYNLFRSDIAALFPGYANSDGAVGHFSLDTRTLGNGVHAIAWSVADDMGHVQGLGSRYFTVQNP